MTARDDMTAILKSGLPDKGYRIVSEIPSANNTPNVLWVLIDQQTINPLAQAPLGAFEVHYRIRVVSPRTDMTAADLQLDDAVFVVLNALTSSGLAFGEATKGQTSAGLLAYDIDTIVRTKKED